LVPLDKNLIYLIVSLTGIVTFIAFALLTFWMGRQLQRHIRNGLQGMIPANSWLGIYPLYDTPIDPRKKISSIRIFQIIAYGLFIFSGFFALSVPSWIILTYVEIFH
jgi:hypothetical protein